MNEQYKDKYNNIIKVGSWLKVDKFEYPKLVSFYDKTNIEDIDKYLSTSLTLKLKVSDNGGEYYSKYCLEDLILLGFITNDNNILTNVELVEPPVFSEDEIFTKTSVELNLIDLIERNKNKGEFLHTKFGINSRDISQYT